ncbi:hypothetical protein ACLBWS_08190 [Brucellaceae bacterium D45D]
MLKYSALPAMRIKKTLDKNEGGGAGDFDIYFTKLLVHPLIFIAECGRSGRQQDQMAVPFCAAQQEHRLCETIAPIISFHLIKSRQVAMAQATLVSLFCTVF